MKKFVILAAVSLVFVGCNNKDNTMNEPSGAQRDQIEQSKEAQKNALNQQKHEIEQSASQSKEQISSEAKAQKQQIESQADAQKAQIEAQKKQVEAQAKAAKANANAQQQVNEAAGAANATAADQKINEQVRDSIKNTVGKEDPAAAQAIMVSTSDGKVTLKGNVKTDAEKQNIEAQAKAIPGVTSVDNQLEVK